MECGKGQGLLSLALLLLMFPFSNGLWVGAQFAVYASIDVPAYHWTVGRGHGLLSMLPLLFPLSNGLWVGGMVCYHCFYQCSHLAMDCG